MKQIFILLMVAMCATMFTACSKDDDKNPLDDNGEGVITMTVEGNTIGLQIYSFNEGDIITIDWGDGDMEEFKSVEEYDEEDEIHYVISIDSYVEHEYSNRNPHIITIKGNIKYLGCAGNNLTSLNVSGCTALTELDCYYNNLTSLDVSGCTALTGLDCAGNNLTSLDVSGCTALTELDCLGNNLTSSALNQIFRDLPQVTSGYIHIYDNPGSETCDKSIAENKGWYVYNITTNKIIY